MYLIHKLTIPQTRFTAEVMLFAAKGWSVDHAYWGIGASFIENKALVGILHLWLRTARPYFRLAISNWRPIRYINGGRHVHD